MPEYSGVLFGAAMAVLWSVVFVEVLGTAGIGVGIALGVAIGASFENKKGK